MFEWHAFLTAGIVLITMATVTWIISLLKKDASIVDSFWSIMIVAAFFVYLLTASSHGVRWFVVGTLLLIWGVRLSLYITVRNWGDDEDKRYQDIRNKYQPHYWIKSLFIVFIFQALLAWLVSLPLLGIVTGSTTISFIDYAGLALVLFGIGFESIADYQLYRFRQDGKNRGQVMDKGLWKYTRHPNYFGEFCVWWGFFLFAISAGAWWSVVSPLIMSFLLLKFSGVVLLEKDISKRRPRYAEYIKSTNAFFPGPSRCS